jgi:hypothetical protein
VGRLFDGFFEKNKKTRVVSPPCTALPFTLTCILMQTKNFGNFGNFGILGFHHAKI